MTSKLLLFRRRELKKGTARKRRVDEEPDGEASSTTTLAEVREKQQLRTIDRRGTPIEVLAGKQRSEDDRESGKRSKLEEEMEDRFDTSVGGEAQGNGSVSAKMKPGLCEMSTKKAAVDDDHRVVVDESTADSQSSKKAENEAATLSPEDQLYVVKKEVSS